LSKLGLSRKIRNQTFDKLEGAFVVLYPLWKQDSYFSCIIKNIEGAEEVARNVSMQAAAMFHCFR
jgi:elongation factor Ts